jgi:uncharacterized protein YkwD
VNRALALKLVVAFAGLAAAGLVTASALATAHAPAKNLPALNKQIFAAVNRFRTSHGLVALTRSRGLDTAALVHSLDMARRGFFSHNSGDGTVFWRRIGKYYGSVDVGENLVWGSAGVSAAAALQEWIKSPPHRRNLRAANWRQLGVSAVVVSNAPGVFHGHRVTIITTDFGVRR